MAYSLELFLENEEHSETARMQGAFPCQFHYSEFDDIYRRAPVKVTSRAWRQEHQYDGTSGQRCTRDSCSPQIPSAEQHF
jgi:ligand-binding SRPBCC domain-containing protein